MSMRLPSGLALKRTKKAKPIQLPQSCGGVLTVSLRLIDMLAIERQLICDEDGRALEALIHGWRSVRAKVADGTLNPIAWLDDVLCELAEMGVWVPPIFLKRLRQLQRGELRLVSETGKGIAVPAEYGLPETFLQAARAIGMRVSVVRRLGGGFEELGTRLDATVAVDGLSRAWTARPNNECEAVEFLRAAAIDCGWRISP